MPTVTTLIHGVEPSSPAGYIAFSSVILVVGERRIVFDSAHVGRRTNLWATLEAHELTPRDIDLHGSEPMPAVISRDRRSRRLIA